MPTGSAVGEVAPDCWWLQSHAARTEMRDVAEEMISEGSCDAGGVDECEVRADSEALLAGVWKEEVEMLFFVWDWGKQR